MQLETPSGQSIDALCWHGALGLTSEHGADGWLRTPTGIKAMLQCRNHAEESIAGFARLGKPWTFTEGF